MILIIDNYDSFTYNVYQYVGEFESDIVIEKNDRITVQKIRKMNCSHIIISPGPGDPNEAGKSMNIIKNFYTSIPILGVCLGHQAIGEAFGCQIKKHSSIYHGKVSKIYHNKESKLYKNIPESFNATRYHSLIISQQSFNNDLIVNAKLKDGTIMGIEHKNAPLYGVQYHPESIETIYGKKIIENFINIV